MVKNDIAREYLGWMTQIICDGQPYKRTAYSQLLRRLYDTDFTYKIPMDGNREQDGIDLRYRFGLENGYGSVIIADILDIHPCSVLEMMVALSIRCEEHIMSDPDIGDRTGEWFWKMMVSLGLEDMDDVSFDGRHVDGVLSRFLDRQYKRNGQGGLFTIEDSKRDMRTIEIWYQMCWYLDETL